jgi:TolB-like protein
MRLYEELTRRRLAQTAALYIAVAWGGIEIIEFLVESLAGNETAVTARRYLAILLIAGFPPAMYLAWTRDLGLKARRLFAATVLTVLVIGLLISIVPEPPPDTAAQAKENSIAILPFDVCDDRPGDRLLAGGLTGAVLTGLAQRDRLKVIGRRSVEYVARSGLPLADVARHLGVEYLLTGHLCRDGIDLNLDAELTDANGFVVWRDSFGQTVNQFDQVEGQLASLIEDSVASRLGDVTTSTRKTAVARKALDNLLIAQEHLRRDQLVEARALLEKALEIQPEYTEALYELAWVEMLATSTAPNREDAMRRARPILDEALTLAKADLQQNSRDYDANHIAGSIYDFLAYLDNELGYRGADEMGDEEIATHGDIVIQYLASAEKHYRLALAANPSDTEIRLSLADVMTSQGVEHRGEVLDILMQGLDTERFYWPLTHRIAFRLAELGRLPEAMEQLDRFEVLPQGKRDLMWGQHEILWNYRQYDELLSYLIDALGNSPGAAGNALAIGHIWTMPANLNRLGLYQEASELYDMLAVIPAPRLMTATARFGGRTPLQYFFEDSYRATSGHRRDVARIQIEPFLGLTADEILKAWHVSAVIVARAFWGAGERERAIELLQALQHYRYPSGRWAQRQMVYPAYLARWLIRVGRHDDAVPVLKRILSQQQNEFDHGVRHPETLLRLAEAYGWLGEEDAALDMFDQAVSYGGLDLLICCEDYVPYQAQDAAGEMQWWHGLESDPRFIQSTSRMRALVDQQRSNIRALLANQDMAALLEPLEYAAVKRPSR